MSHYPEVVEKIVQDYLAKSRNPAEAIPELRPGRGSERTGFAHLRIVLLRERFGACGAYPGGVEKVG